MKSKSFTVKVWHARGAKETHTVEATSLKAAKAKFVAEHGTAFMTATVGVTGSDVSYNFDDARVSKSWRDHGR